MTFRKVVAIEVSTLVLSIWLYARLDTADAKAFLAFVIAVFAWINSLRGLYKG